MISLLTKKIHLQRFQYNDLIFDEIAKFRYKAYCEELKFLNKEDFPEKRESDKYDEQSIHIVVLSSKEILGYTRVILPTINPLPIFNEFQDVRIKEEGKSDNCCEISRFIISSKYRHKQGTRREIFRLLAEEILKVVNERDIKCLFAIVEEWLYLSLKKRGYNFVRLNEEGKEYLGAITFPVKLDV